MTLLRHNRITIEPADAGEMRASHTALVATIKDAFRGLIHQRLAKVDDQTWLDTPPISPSNSPKPSMRNRTQPGHHPGRPLAALRRGEGT